MAGSMRSPPRKRRGLKLTVRSFLPGALAAALLWAAPSGAEVFVVSDVEALANEQTSNLPDHLVSDQSPDIEAEPSTRLFLQRVDLEAWAKNTLGEAETKGQFVGVGVAVFRPEGPVFVKGFGYSDFESRDPLHPGVTYLPAAQLGNLFVAEMLVDLEAAGRLNLDDSIDDYLTRVALPPALRHLGIRDLFGFETGLTPSVRGTHMARGQIETGALGHIKSMLRKSAPEGRHDPASSVLASALASLIVEDVSGQKIEQGLGELLADRWGTIAWFNTTGSQQPKYTSQHHRISRFGEIKRKELHAASSGFVASQGVYLTLNAMTQILANQLKGLEEKSPRTERVVELAFTRNLADGTAGSVPQVIQILELQGNVNTSSVHVVLVPELELGLLAVVNSASQTPDLLPGGGRKKILPPLSASDITDSFLQSFIPLHEPVLTPDTARSFDGQGTQAARALIGSDRFLDLLTPLHKRSSVNALMVLFSLSVVLQFALLASARWPVPTGGQRAAKWLGMVSVVFMTATLTFPAVLLVLGHSKTLVDPLYLISRWAFPIASLMATATLIACLIGWKKGFWGDENDGFKRRLCFTVGSLGVFGLAVVSWQLDLILPVF